MGSASTRLVPTKPIVLVYEDSPLYGPLWNREVGGEFVWSAKEVSFSAFPLFFSVSSRLDPALSYSWSVDGSGRQSGSKVTYRAPEEAEGISRIQVDVENLNQFVQTARRNLTIKFGQNIF